MINADAASTLYQITVQGNTTMNGFPVLGHDFRICSTIPHSLSADSCTPFWDGTPGMKNTWNSTSPSTNESGNALVQSSSVVSSVTSSFFTSSNAPAAFQAATSARRTVTVIVAPTAAAAPSAAAVHDDDDLDDDLAKRDKSGTVSIQSVQKGDTSVVTVSGPGFRTPATLEQPCVWALHYPVAVLLNTKREDIVFVAFQLWVLGMSTVALLNESIPHIIASLLTHVLATAWAGFQIVNTGSFQKDFVRLTTEGACKPVNLLPLYWRQRRSAELPSLILNVVALFVSAFLTWKLIKLFGWQTFKRVGASLTIHRFYKAVLVLSITLQLSLFFIFATVALWIDQLYNGSIGRLTAHAQVYKIMGIMTLMLLIPWLTTGWVAVRRELKIPMMIFLVLSIGYLAGSGIMFVSDSFRWTFMEWRFFSFVSLASVLLTAFAFILGVVCRLNFGKGLSPYLNSQAPLPGDDFEPAYQSHSDIEKFNFPSKENVIPSFSATFESPYANDYDAVVTVPSTAHLRSPSDQSSHSSHDTRFSRNSNGSSSSTGSPTKNNKRWVIE